MRIHKYLSQAWICSRRKAEEYIERWLVKINWKKAKIWDQIDPIYDKIEFEEKAIEEQKNLVYYKLNKPAWIVTTCSKYWEKNIIDILDIKQRVFPIGRLDKNTTWLILLTNDGRLTNYLIHPRYEHEKEYIVQTFWPIWDEELEKLEKWVYILWKMTKKAKVKRISSWTFSITITEWRNRQIRRMLEKVWSKVKKLKRVRIENIELWNLQIWEYKMLTKNELNKLFEKIDLEKTI